MVRGVLHIHSRHSDGELTIAELRSLYLAAGCRFACITDHADHLDGDRLISYLHDCAAHSDEAFFFVPGLEFSCRERMHILGFGVTAPCDSTDPETVLRHIKRYDGVAVIAHPRDTAFDSIERFDPLPDGIETWNTKYDGRFAPRPETFALLARIRARAPATCAFYGQDFHWRTQYHELFTTIDAAEPTPGLVLDALRRGNFVGVKDQLELRADGVLPPAVAARFARVQQRFAATRGWSRRVYGWIKTAGLAKWLVPVPLKSQLRRLL